MVSVCMASPAQHEAKRSHGQTNQGNAGEPAAGFTAKKPGHLSWLPDFLAEESSWLPPRTTSLVYVHCTYPYKGASAYTIPLMDTGIGLNLVTKPQQRAIACSPPAVLSTTSQSGRTFLHNRRIHPSRVPNCTTVQLPPSRPCCIPRLLSLPLRPP